MGKKLIQAIGIAALLAMMAVGSAKAQTNLVSELGLGGTNLTQVDQALSALGTSITNFAVDLYGTYAPKAPEHWGGGGLFAYNFSQYVGGAIGIDWLGSFNLVSGNITLKAPFHVTTIIPALGKVPWLASLKVTPFVLAGIAAPFGSGSADSSSPVTVADVGAAITFGHLFGGEFNAGGTYGKWYGAGPYDVARAHAFIGWQLNF